MSSLVKDKQYFKFCSYGFLKNLRFFDAFFILFLLDKGLSFTQIGILYAVREILINIFEIPSGIFADSYGRKNSLLASFFFYIFSFLIFYTAHDFWFFLMAFTLYGMADAFRSGTHKAMIMDYLKLNKREKQKVNYYGHTRSCSQKGSAISALLAGLIVFYYGNYNSIFIFSVIPYLLNLFLILSYPKNLNLSTVHKKPKKNLKIGDTLKTFFKIIRQPSVLKIINTSALHTAYQRAIKDYIQPLMLNVALLIPLFVDIEVQKKNGLIIGVIYFIIYLLTSQASKFASLFDQKTKRKTSYITLLYGFFFGIISGIFFVNELWVLSLLTFVGIYIIENIRKPVLTGILADNVPNDILTSILSAQSLWKTIITALIALLMGILADHFGVGAAYAIVSAILLLSTIIANRFTVNLSST